MTEDYCEWLSMNNYKRPETGIAVALSNGDHSNGVSQAEQRMKILSVDQSTLGLDKTRKLATTAIVKLITVFAELANYTF